MPDRGSPARLVLSGNEREADKAFTSFVSKVTKEKPFEENNVKKAQSIAIKFPGTKTAARAERFVALSKVPVSK